MHDNLDRALRLSPGDPTNLSDLGRLYGLRLELEELDAEEIVELGGVAGGYYAEALALRPTWPWDWGNLALVMYERRQEAHDVFHEALVRTVDFGPREPYLQQLVSELGLKTWEALSPVARGAVARAIDGALESGSLALVEMTDATTAAMAPVCAEALEGLPLLGQRCDQLRAQALPSAVPAE